MENRAHAVGAGLFAIFFGLLLAIAAYWFAGEHGEEDTYLFVSQSSVSGLSLQGEVRYRGLQVGRIKQIEIDPASPRTILVLATVKRGTPVTDATYARLAYQGVTGLSYLQLDDDGKPGRPLTTSRKAPARIEVRPSLLEDVADSGQALIKRVNDVSLRMSRLLSDKNLERFDHTLANAEAASAKLAPALDALPAMAADARLTLKRADTLIADLDAMTKALKQRMGSLDRLAESAERIGKAGEAISDELANSTLPKLDRTLDSTQQAAGKLNNLLDDLSNQPQSLIFGKPDAAPGPGEAGFAPPR
jgi:phospholipid/cholesterol/gamma-HCH transport system substrate-binding protein